MKLGAVVHVVPPKRGAAVRSQEAHELLWSALAVRVVEDRKASGIGCYVVTIKGVA